MDSPPVPSELLVDIFLRLPDPADLAHASAACVSLRRLVADRSFLRQYRKLHPPPLLGGRVLLGRSFLKFDSTINLKEIVVCDPLHRQYLLLPPIPDKLSREVCIPRNIFLVPPAGSVDKEETWEETAFRVIWMAQRRDKLVAIVFSSSTGQWQDGPSHSWSNSFAGLLNVPGMVNVSRPQYVYGCFYWVTDCREILIVLDAQRMELSIAVAPTEAKGSADVMDIAIVEAKNEATNDLNYSIRQNNCVSSSLWQFERTVSLDFKFSLMGSAGRDLYLFQQQSPSLDGACFSLDVKTFQLQRVFVSNSYMPYGCTYSSFPPSLLSTPTISNGVQEEIEKEVLEEGCAANSSAESPWLSD